MTAREWIALPIAMLGWLFLEGGEWAGGKLVDLADRVAGPHHFGDHGA